MHGTIVTIEKAKGIAFGTVETLSGQERYEFTTTADGLAVGQLVEFAVRPVAVNVHPARNSSGERLRG